MLYFTTESLASSKSPWHVTVVHKYLMDKSLNQYFFLREKSLGMNEALQWGQHVVDKGTSFGSHVLALSLVHKPVLIQ